MIVLDIYVYSNPRNSASLILRFQRTKSMYTLEAARNK